MTYLKGNPSMTSNITPVRPAASIRYDRFEGSFPEATPGPDGPRIHISLRRANPSVRNLAALNPRQTATSSNPLHFVEASSLKNPSNEKQMEKITQESLPDVYRSSVKCMNKIIKELLPHSKEQALALFTEADRLQQLLPQHRLKVVEKLQ